MPRKSPAAQARLIVKLEDAMMDALRPFEPRAVDASCASAFVLAYNLIWAFPHMPKAELSELAGKLVASEFRVAKKISARMRRRLEKSTHAS